MKQTQDQQRKFNLFVKECKRWQPILAAEYDVEYRLVDPAEDTFYAQVTNDISAGTALIELNVNRLDECLDKSVCRTAFEEIAHLLLKEYRWVSSAFIAETFIDAIEHRIINKLKTHLIK